MSISHWAVKRPVTTLMIVLTLIVFGGVSFTRLPIALMPDLELPFAVVATDYENVGPREVESQVTIPVESAMATLSNLSAVSSVSATGQSVVITQFNWGTNLDTATQEIRDVLDLVSGSLPEAAGDPLIQRFDPNQFPIMQFVVGSERDLAELRSIVDETIASRLERLEGVASVGIIGGRAREIQVSLNAARLQQFGLTTNQIVGALQGANLNLPGGRLSDSGQEWVVRTVGEFDRVDDISQVVVDAGPGRVVRLGDVAQVTDGFTETEQLARLNGERSLGLNIQMESGGNTVQVSNLVNAELEQLARELDDIEFHVIWDDADFIRFSISSVVQNALLGALFATIVLLFFMRDWRALLVLLSSIPVAGIATLAVLYFTDTSLNMLSLGGLALGVGMLVDNSIVVLENISRRRELGEEMFVAAADGTREVTGAITASTLTTLAVFFPIVFVEGIASELFGDLSLAVSASLTATVVVAVTLVPMLAARVMSPLRSGAQTPDAGQEGAARTLGDPTINARGGAIGTIQARYAGFTAALLRRRWTVVIALVLMVGAGLFSAGRVGFEFLPATDSGDMSVSVEMPPGTPLESTDDVVARLERFVATIPEVDEVFSNVGGTSGATGALSVRLVSASERNRSTVEVAEEVRRFAARIPDATISATSSDSMGVGVAGAPVQLQIRGDDLDAIEQYSIALAERLSSVNGLREVASSASERLPELQLQVDRDRAASLGLNVQQIATALQTAVSGQVATRYREAGDEIDVRVQLQEEARSSTSDLEQILIDTPVGVTVPLHEVATIVEGGSLTAITRDAQERGLTVDAQLFGRDLGSTMTDVRDVVAEFPPPEGIRVEYGGQDEMMQEAFGGLALAFLLGVLLVYMILAAQFESITQPITIMVTVPLAIIGAFIGMGVSGWSVSVPAFIGLIMLVGIVVNNGILLVSHINQLREAGYDRLRAIQWGCRNRLRPVLMTASTTILGMLPLALGLGEGTEMQAPIAVAVISGLFISTLLTLGFVPVVYSAIDDLERWFARVFLRRGSDSSTAIPHSG